MYLEKTNLLTMSTEQSPSCERDSCECDEESSSSSSSSSSDKEEIEETVREVLDDIIEEHEQASVSWFRRIPERYLKLGALALPWTILLLGQVDFGACPWLNSTFSWS